MTNENIRVKGPHVTELERVLAQTVDFQTSIVIEFDPAKPIPINTSRQTKVTIDLDIPRNNRPKTLLELRTPYGCFYKGEVSDGMLDLAEICAAGLPFKERGTLLPEFLTVKAKNAPVPLKELRQLALQAWFEAFGLDLPNPKDLKAKADEQKAIATAKREEHLNALKSGVANWAQIPRKQLDQYDYKKSDLAGAQLGKLKLEDVDFRNSNFNKANLSEAEIHSTDIRNATFCGANMTAVKCTHRTQFTGCDFTGANLEGAILEGSCNDCKFDGAILKNAYFKYSNGLARASFNNTDFSNAHIISCDLKGADFSYTIFADTEFIDCFYNAETKWPESFQRPKGVEFKGSGADPFLTAALKAESIAGPIDFDTFIAQLNKKFDQDRLKKSLKMLKSERFQLFSEVNDSSVVGIVKSQTDAELVYSCRLTDGGDFSCCTQNLNYCGGLRGALCKHLLVLLIGLAKAKELDATKTYQWVIQSLAKKPELNKEVASEVFLRYKAVEAGDLDWRPTETMPEDYYAY